MKKPNVVVCCAPFSLSGYANHGRVVLRALRKIEDKINLSIFPYNWAMTSNTFRNEEEMWFIEKINNFNQAMLGHYDLSVQLDVPSSWKNYAKVNVGITAGVETLTCNKNWIPALNNMSRVIVPCEFVKQTFQNSQQESKLSVPIEVIGFPAEDGAVLDLKLDLKTKFNFLAVGQIAPRKNIEKMIHFFVEEFFNDKDVGLVLKISHRNNSIPDKFQCRRMLDDIMKNFEGARCKVYLLHGDMTDEEMLSLSSQENIHAFVSISAGESWGIPQFSAACSGLPVIASDYGGGKSYLYAEKVDEKGKKRVRPYFQRVLGQIKPVEPHQVMGDIILPDMMWFHPNQKDFKQKMREVVSDYGRFKKQAKELQPILAEKFNKEKIENMLIETLLRDFDLTQTEEEIIESD